MWPPLESSLSAIRSSIARHEPFTTLVLRDSRRVRLSVPSLPAEATALGAGVSSH